MSQSNDSLINGAQVISFSADKRRAQIIYTQPGQKPRTMHVHYHARVNAYTSKPEKAGFGLLFNLNAKPNYNG